MAQVRIRDRKLVRNESQQIITSVPGNRAVVDAEVSLARIIAFNQGVKTSGVLRAEKLIQRISDWPRESFDVEAVESLHKEQRRVFLILLEECGMVNHCRNSTCIDKNTLGKWRKNRGFARRCKQARDTGGEIMELHLRNLALNGLVKKKFTADGRPVEDPKTGEQYEEREFDPSLIKLYLRHNNKKYRNVRPDELPNQTRPINFSLNIGTKVVNTPDNQMIIRQETKMLPEIVDGELNDEGRTSGSGPALSGEGPTEESGG